jgi:hypothetical protein
MEKCEKTRVSAEENKGTKQMNFLFSVSNSFHRLSFRFFLFLFPVTLPSVSIGYVSNLLFSISGIFGFVSLGNPITFLIFLFFVFTAVFQPVFFYVFDQ